MGRWWDMGTCQKCEVKRRVYHTEWGKVGTEMEPRCRACGGAITPSDPARREWDTTTDVRWGSSMRERQIRQREEGRDERYAYVHKTLDLEGPPPDASLAAKMHYVPFGVIEASCYENAADHLRGGYRISGYRIIAVEDPGFDITFDRDKKWEFVRKTFIEADKKRGKRKE